MLSVVAVLWGDDALAFGPGGSSIMRRTSSISHREEMASEQIRPIARGNGARSMTMMPIGIPKVAYRMPGSRGGEWLYLLTGSAPRVPRAVPHASLDLQARPGRMWP